MEREGEGERAHFHLETGSPNYEIKEKRVKINHLKLKAVLPVHYKQGLSGPV
jgi:hypothetical protein